MNRPGAGYGHLMTNKRRSDKLPLRGRRLNAATLELGYYGRRKIRAAPARFQVGEMPVHPLVERGMCRYSVCLVPGRVDFTRHIDSLLQSDQYLCDGVRCSYNAESNVYLSQFRISFSSNTHGT